MKGINLKDVKQIIASKDKTYLRFHNKCNFTCNFNIICTEN